MDINLEKNSFETDSANLIKVLPVTPIKKQTSITFNNPRNTTQKLLQPLVQSNYKTDSSGKTTIQVSAIIFLSTTSEKVEFCVFQGAFPNGVLAFKIVCNEPRTSTNTFSAYQVNFNTSSETINNQLVVFQDDIDPELSRGTLTTVQRPA